MRICHSQFNCFLVLFLYLFCSCSVISTSNPTSETKKLFNEWISLAGIPYKNASYEVITNDNTFATVRITADFRTSVTENWQEKQTDVDCRHVGSNWQCSSAFIFALTEAEQSKQNEIISGTATAAAIQYQVTATELARQFEGTQAVLSATQVFVDQKNRATATAMSLAFTETAHAYPSFAQPVQVQVYANLGWQDTGVLVKSGQSITISVVSGSWTYYKGVSPYDQGQGGTWICADHMDASSCAEPLPDFPAGGLIGKINNNLFGIGNYTIFIPQQDGYLQLGINDIDMSGNDGSLVVTISMGG